MKDVTLAVLLAAFTLGLNATVAAKPEQQLSKDTAVVQSSSALKLNQASVEQLVAVPGLGRAKAQAVVDYIAENGPIRSQAQLTEVKGIGEKLASRVAQYVSFD